METLDTLLEFAQNYPQIENEKLQYAFTGGTAVRLHQEVLDASYKRIITDFDLLVFGDKKYPVHSFYEKNSLLIGDYNQHKNHVLSAKIIGTKFYFMDGTFLAFSKLSTVDNPREKDYEDIKFLYKNEEVDKNQLVLFFKNSKSLNNNPIISLNLFEWFMGESHLDRINDKIRLFQSFPNLINILDKFEDPEIAFSSIFDYVKKDSYKTGYHISTILQNINSVLVNLEDFQNSVKNIALANLLKIAKDKSYTDFDSVINNWILPELNSIDDLESKLMFIKNIY